MDASVFAVTDLILLLSSAKNLFITFSRKVQTSKLRLSHFFVAATPLQ